MEHSKLLNDSVKLWIEHLDSHYCKIGVFDYPDNKKEGEPYKEKFKKLISSNLEELKYYDSAESHLKSKYPEILTDWKQLKETSENFNNTLVSILDDMYTAILEISPLSTCFVQGKKKGEFIVPWFAATTFYRWITQEMRRETNSKLEFNFHPNLEKEGLYEWEAFVFSGSQKTTVAVKSKEKGEKIVRNMYGTLKQDYLDRITHCVKVENERNERKRDFIVKVNDVLIKSIENGKVIKGKCKYC